MTKIIVREGDEVTLFNGTEGIISEIDKSVYRFIIPELNSIWFHIRDIKVLNGEQIDNDLLSF